MPGNQSTFSPQRHFGFHRIGVPYFVAVVLALAPHPVQASGIIEMLMTPFGFPFVVKDMPRTRMSFRADQLLVMDGTVVEAEVYQEGMVRMRADAHFKGESLTLIVDNGRRMTYIIGPKEKLGRPMPHGLEIANPRAEMVSLGPDSVEGEACKRSRVVPIGGGKTPGEEVEVCIASDGILVEWMHRIVKQSRAHQITIRRRAIRRGPLACTLFEPPPDVQIMQ